MRDASDLLITLQNHKTFYSVACLAYQDVQRLLREREAYRERVAAQARMWTEDDDDQLAVTEAAIQRCAMVTVVFSALALEAFINDYGIERFSRSFFDKYLDRLHPVAKWIILPNLVTGRRPRTDTEGFERLRALFVLRNHLVHFKTVTKRVSKITDKDHLTEHHARDAIKGVRAMVLALGRLAERAGQKVETEWLSEAAKLPTS